MEYRTLGHSNIKVSELAFGAWIIICGINDLISNYNLETKI
jgi:aryl-alcohol dehydrogenase-like predicted oxidoreductase